jgi:multiple sugar transport system substrate-binding protein
MSRKTRNSGKVWAIAVFLLLVVPCILFAEGAKEKPKVLSVLVQGGSESHTFAQATAAEFKQLTGYDVNIVAVPYEGLYDKMTAETVSPQSSYDLACVDFLWLPAWAHKLVPLDDLLTADVRSDLFAVSIAGGTYKGKFYGMPTWESCKVLIYRTDLFGDEKEKQAFRNQYGYELTPPKTWQEFIDVARFFTRDTNNDGVIELYGTYVGGAPHEDNACSWFDFALQAGADHLIVDDQGKVIIDSKPYVDGLAFMGDQLNKYKVAPPGALEMLCVQGAELFQDGKLAMMLNWPFAYRMAQDPAGSKVVGKVDSRPMIAGSAGVGVTSGTWINIIPASSKNVDMAKKYIKFWYERDKTLFKLTGEAARKSTFADYKDKSGYETVGPLLTSLAAPRSAPRPLLVKYQQVSTEAILPALQSVLSGSRTPQEAAKWAGVKVAEILK